MDELAKNVRTANNPGKSYFIMANLKYAYTQFILHNDKKHSNFNLLGGNATGADIFLNGF